MRIPYRLRVEMVKAIQEAKHQISRAEERITRLREINQKDRLNKKDKVFLEASYILPKYRIAKGIPGK